MDQSLVWLSLDLFDQKEIILHQVSISHISQFLCYMPMNRKGKGTTLSSLFFIPVSFPLLPFTFQCCFSISVYLSVDVIFYQIERKKIQDPHLCWCSQHLVHWAVLFLTHISNSRNCLPTAKNILKCYCRCDPPSDRCNCAIITPGTQFPFSGSILNL